MGGAGGAGGATVQKNHPTVATIPGGAIVEREISSELVQNGSLNLMLREADYTSAARMAEAINRVFPNTAVAKDARTVNVIVPPEYKKVYPEMGLKRGEHKGNMIINFHVDFPTILTTEQIDKLSAIL